MQVPLKHHDIVTPGPMGDDWLTRDPESFTDRADTHVVDETSSIATPSTWRRVRDDLLLYVAGIATGLVVVVTVSLVFNLLGSTAVAITPPVSQQVVTETQAAVSR